VVVAWGTGLAGVYALLSLLHAALVQRILTVDVGFGRSLAFWIGAVYVLLLGWGFVPKRPTGRYAARPVVYAMLGLGMLALAVCGMFTALWLASHWVPSVGGPVTASMAVLIVAALVVLWLAGYEDRKSDRNPATQE
jgi:hypothetical protein